MKQDLTAAIAWRYLLSKKSHGAVGTISTVSLCAMAVATAAIVCVLSVFNGFREGIAEKLDTLAPDVMVTPAKGKTFAEAEKLAARVAAGSRDCHPDSLRQRPCDMQLAGDAGEAQGGSAR